MIIIKYLTEKQLCEVLCVDRTMLWRLRDEGMPHIVLGSRTIRYLLADVLEWLEGKEVKANE
jgi:predicted DNA-binding transcriptional regulator AlpA